MLPEVGIVWVPKSVLARGLESSLVDLKVPSGRAEQPSVTTWLSGSGWDSAGWLLLPTISAEYGIRVASHPLETGAHCAADVDATRRDRVHLR